MLSDARIRSTKPGEKPIRLSDEKGLYLEVCPSGGKWWRLKYRFAGKEKLLSMGTGITDLPSQKFGIFIAGTVECGLVRKVVKPWRARKPGDAGTARHGAAGILRRRPRLEYRDHRSGERAPYRKWRVVIVES